VSNNTCRPTDISILPPTNSRISLGLSFTLTVVTVAVIIKLNTIKDIETKYKKTMILDVDLYQEKNDVDNFKIKNDDTPYVRIIIKITIDVL
jgi:hypothetical protein